MQDGVRGGSRDLPAGPAHGTHVLPAKGGTKSFERSGAGVCPLSSFKVLLGVGVGGGGTGLRWRWSKWPLAMPPHLGTSWELTRLAMVSQPTEILSSVGRPSAFSPGRPLIDGSIEGALSHSLPVPPPALLALLGPPLRIFGLPVSERVRA